MATTNIKTSLPELVLAPGQTITVDTGDASATISLLNVYGVTPVHVEVPEFDVLPPLLGYGAEQ